MWEYVWVGAACFGVCAAGVGTSIGVHARRVQSLGRGLRGLARGGVAGAAELVPAVVHAVQTTDGLLALWTACQGPDLSDSVASSDPSPTATATATAIDPRRVPPATDGAHLFSRFIDLSAPYSGSICAVVRLLRPGAAAAEIPGRAFGLQNPFASVHALAQANAAELCSGLAVLTALQDAFPLHPDAANRPPRPRGIVTSLRADYHRKARGTLLATAECSSEWLDTIRRTAHMSAKDALDTTLPDALVVCHIFSDPSAKHSTDAHSAPQEPLATVTVTWSFAWPASDQRKKNN